MGTGSTIVVLAAMGGGGWWLYQQQLRQQQQHAAELAAVQAQAATADRGSDRIEKIRLGLGLIGAFTDLGRGGETPGRTGEGGAGSVLDRVGDALAGRFLGSGTPDRPAFSSPVPRPRPSTGGTIATGSTRQILALIRRHESRGDYGAIWSGIARSDYPPRPLTLMTVGQVLAWQDSIDARYRSEAAGAYQVLEDTLRGLVARGVVGSGSRFDAPTQDRIAVALMERRGLSRFRRGQITAQAFAQNLSKEWASLPAQTRDQRGRPATGQSYYAGDGLNTAHTSKAAVLGAVRAIA